MKNKSLYIHIPFCKTKCAYCDFFRVTDFVLAEKYVDALIFEISKLDSCSDICTIYIGGGTPSVLQFDLIEKILSFIKNKIDVENIEEFTVECNPEDVSDKLIYILKRYGVNRISLGVQTLNDDMLRFLNRRHNSDKVYNSIEIIKNTGIKNISVDMIFGLPKIENYNFKNDVEKFLKLDIKHFSAYALSYEKNSYLSVLLKNKKIVPLSDDEVAWQYEYLTSELKKNGFYHYEISNYCRNKIDGFNENITCLNNNFYNSKHNTYCWIRKPYYGIGAGAYSFDGQKRWNNVADIKKYISLVDKTDEIREYEYLTEKDVYNEIVMLGLRTSFGVSKKNISEKYKNYFLKKVEQLCSDGLLIKISDYDYRIPESKWFLLDLITEKMML